MSTRLSPWHLSLMCSAALLLACAETAQMQGQLSGLKDVVKKAQDNGAKYCAPRELALAESHLEFAQAELEQGFASKAQRHLWIAEPNAEAAVFLSPPEKCAYAGDRDGDGYIDSQDKCPDQPENYNGFQDGDGCPDDPDTDMDGIPDSVDQCVLDPEDKDNYLDDDGCPDLDNDADQILDSKDKCPNEAEDRDGFEDEDGCPDPDNDKDKVLDVDDMCPNEPGPSDKEPKGCPQKPALAVVTESEIKISQQIHFEYNKAIIRQDSFPVVDAVAEILKKYPDLKMEIQGHTDNKGGPDYNKRLSDLRAAAVRTYLIEHGIASDRLTSHGYGLERPLVPNDSDNNRALNRRVQFVRTDVAKEGQSQ
jgi:OOP family OmpA-OmpF porin